MSKIALLKRLHNYKVEFALFEQYGQTIRKPVISWRDIPHVELTQWLSDIETPKIRTRERYAYGIVNYLRYFDSLGLHYTEVTRLKQIKDYIKHLLHTLDENIKSTDSLRSFQTIRNLVSIISSFCSWLEQEYTDYKSPFRSRQIYNGDSQTFKVMHRYTGLGLSKMSFKAKRSYRKWYTQEEKEALASNFRTLRDKCIFMISIDVGCRIDEILNIKRQHYNSETRQLWIEKSKTIPRFVTLDPKTCVEIDRYLLTEWQDAETKSGQILEYMFVNLQRGEIGKQVGYRSLYGILKTCAKRAGLDPGKIIFHAGRSTRAQELIEMQVLHPEDGITDAIICELMGWSSIASVAPYKREFNGKISKIASDKVIERRRNSKKTEERSDA